MNFETGNTGQQPTKRIEDKPSRFMLPSFVKKIAAISALAVASYMSWDKFHIHDYTDAGRFNSAFKKARKDHRKIFVWNGKKFTTELVDKELSENYLESKKFLEDYYSSDYFRSKHVLTDLQYDQVKYDILDKSVEDPRYKELSDKILSSKLSKEEMEEWHKFSEKIQKYDSIPETQEFKDKVKELETKEGKERIKNLKEPIYFSMTHQKGEIKEDGYYDPKKGNIFIYRNKENKDHNYTTSVHELTHKSTRSSDILINNNTFIALIHNAYESAKNNKNFLIKYGQKGFDYLSRPTEIDARQNSTRFYLFKHFSGYTANTTFTQEHYDFLKQNYEKLPYDIQQLLDLFSEKEVFIDNMNKY